MQVLLHQLEVARLVLHFNLRFEALGDACVEIAYLFCLLWDALCTLWQMDVSRPKALYINLK